MICVEAGRITRLRGERSTDPTGYEDALKVLEDHGWRVVPNPELEMDDAADPPGTFRYCPNCPPAGEMAATDS